VPWHLVSNNIHKNVVVYFISDARCLYRKLATQVLHSPHHTLRETAVVNLVASLVNLVAYERSFTLLVFTSTISSMERSPLVTGHFPWSCRITGHDHVNIAQKNSHFKKKIEGEI
jgi:hypothetical protein